MRVIPFLRFGGRRRTTDAVTDPLPTLEEQRDYWDHRWSATPTPNSWQLRRAAEILRLLGTLALERPRILDAGCGTGWFTERLSQRGDALGIDLSEAAIAEAHARHPGVRYLAANIYETPLPREHFDVIVSQEVIAHVENQHRYMDLLTDGLRPGGYLILTSANPVVVKRMGLGPDPSQHIKSWVSRGGLVRLLAPRYRVLWTTTVIPLGHEGFLGFVNSARLNRAFSFLIPQARLDALKEWAGLGYSIVLLAQKTA